MSVDQRDPEAVVRAVATALHQERWRDAAALCSAGSLAEHQRSRVQLLREARPVFASFEQFRAISPETPEEVARWQWERHYAHHDPGDHVRQVLEDAGVGSLDELATLDPAECYARFLDARSPRRRNAAMLEARGVAPRVRAWFDEHVARHPRLLVLGHVREGELQAHVVVRELPDAPPPTLPNGRRFDEVFDEDDLIHATTSGPLRIVTVHLGDDGRWWLEAEHDLLGFGSGIVAYGAEYFVSEEEEADWEGEPPDD